ncbi:MAG: twin-arginine translocase TatA/TatE family subunit [Nitrospirota bacterium]
MFDLGTQELIVIFIVAFLVFGPKKLPELGRTLGKGIRDLKTAMRGVTESFSEAESDITEGFKKTKDDLEESITKSIEDNINSEEEEKKTKENQQEPREEENSSTPDEEEGKAESKETDKDG